jgi:hypothetical protein
MGAKGPHASSQPFRLEVISRQELENVRAGSSLSRVTISCEAILSAKYRMKGAGSLAWAEIRANKARSISASGPAVVV